MRISRIVVVSVLCAAVTSAFGQFRVPEGLSPAEAARFERFEDFQIKGVCGTRDLDRLSRVGANTVRGYTIPAPAKMRATLDEVHRLGLTMVVSEWMPHHGENKGRNGVTWTFDYDTKGDELVEKFVRKVEAIGDHPAILMWGLGNEVHLDEPYLRTVNRMSLAIHERFPLHITSLTMVNAKPDAIKAVKQYAPDLDVLGIQSYSPGAVRGGIKSTETHWGKPFYMSEFNGKGPWNFKKTAWGEAFDEPVTQKVVDLKACYDAIDASTLCLGSTVFVWGHFGANRPTYFSLLLDENPNGPANDESTDELLVTPQAEVVIEYFSGRPVDGNRAPVLSRIVFADGARDQTVRPGAPVRVSLAAEDVDGDAIKLVAWVIKSGSKRRKIVAGPFEADAQGLCEIEAPDVTGDFLVMAYAMDQNGGGSASTLPLAVRDE